MSTQKNDDENVVDDEIEAGNKDEDEKYNKTISSQNNNAKNFDDD